MTNITGSCLCGNLRYTVRSDPVLTGICHCKSCQKQTGAAFAVAIVVPKSSLSIEGDLASFEVVGASGLPTRRVFCPKCGSPIAVDPSSNPNITFISAGTLDDTSWLKPTVQQWCESAQPWVHISAETQNFPNGMPG
jgi:hypothetical protein